MTGDLELNQQEEVPVPATAGQLLELVDELIIAVEGLIPLVLVGIGWRALRR